MIDPQDFESLAAALDRSPNHRVQRRMVTRDRFAEYMRGQGVECSARHVLITSGSQQALDLLTALFVEPGVRVGVQAPTYPGTLGILRAHGATIDTIDELGRVASGAAIIFATANFHNPTAATLDVDERLALLDLAEHAGAVLVEDDPYKHFRAIATRFEKIPENYLALIKLAAVRIWLRAYESVS